MFVDNDFPVFKFACTNEYSWDNNTSERAEKLLSDLSKAIDGSNLIYIDNNDDADVKRDFKVWQSLKFDLYTRSENSSKIEHVAELDKNGLKATKENSLKISTKRFFRIGIVEGVPWTYRKRDPISKRVILDENNDPIYEGYCIDFIKKLAQAMNFSYELVPPTSGKFGEKLGDGSFDGVVGDLIEGETDIIVAALKMTAEREEFIDFVAPYFEQTGISIVMKKPVPDRSLFKFMTVLKLEVWMSICGAIIATAFVIWILEIFSPYSSRNFKYEEVSR
jgi:glutamate receptor, ionotropic, invertebrate